MSVSEKDLIKRAKKDPAVLKSWYEDHYPKIFNYILHRVGVIQVAEDITSEGFFKVFKYLPLFQWRNISLLSWTYKIATNEISSYFRKNKYKPISLEQLLENKGIEVRDDTDPQQELAEAEAILEQHQEFLQVRKKITKLPLKYQNVITLRYFENKKVKEIAEILGKKESTVSSLLCRGIQKLRILLKI